MQARTLITLGKMSLSHLKKSIKKDSGYCFLKSLQLRGGGGGVVVAVVVGWVYLFLRTLTGVLPSLASLELPQSNTHVIQAFCS